MSGIGEPIPWYIAGERQRKCAKEKIVPSHLDGIYVIVPGKRVKEETDLDLIFTDEEDGLPQWVTLLYEKVDGDNIAYLRNRDKEYQEVMREKDVLRSQYPCIDRLMAEPEAMEISSGEHEKFLEYLALRNEMECRGRELYYRCGHVHCYEYMKKIGR